MQKSTKDVRNNPKKGNMVTKPVSKNAVPNPPKNKKKKKKKHPILRGFIKAFFILLVIGIVAGVGLAYGFVQSVVNGAGALSKDDFKIGEFTTTIYDKDGNVYSQLYGNENRTYVSLDKTSPHLKDAFIAIEDERFESHFGIDLKRTGAAVLKFVTTGNSDFGGSTITQQLIKKVTKDEDRSWQRKAREIVRAIQVEKWLTKDEIIEMYMNLIYLGEGAYGVEKAAYTYFAKSASDLTVAECALIASLAQSPEGRNPYEHPEAAKERQKLVLGKMKELGKITTEEYEEAMAQELVYQKGEQELTAVNSYFVDAVIDQLEEDIQEQKGVTPIMAQTMLYSGGLKIYTTLDPKIQSILEDVYQNQDYFKQSNGKYDPDIQSAMVVIDYRKGNVVGLVGGAGEKTELRSFNRATMMTRAPGSTIKPVATYAPGIDTGTFTAATTFDDSPLYYSIYGSVWTPKNAYSGYRGLTSVRKGVEISSNIVASRAFLQLGAETSFRYLENFGYTTLESSDKGPGALALGGLTRGVTPLEHAAAYGTIANSGIYVSPKLYTKVLDMNSQVLLENKSTVRTVIKDSTAYIVTSMLQDVINGSEATGYDARFSGMALAGKTGTSNDSKDRWFAGFSPYYVAATWVGYDQQKTVNMSGNPAAKIWKAVMSKIHEGLENTGFERPNNIVSASVCADSGLLCTDACRQDPRGDRTKSELFVRGTVPGTYCNVHQIVEVCPATFQLPNPVCLRSCTPIKRVFINREYKKEPSPPPRDYPYEIPSVYCEFHYCPVDENGNFVTTTYIPEDLWNDVVEYDGSVEDDDSKKQDKKNKEEDKNTVKQETQTEKKPTPTPTPSPTKKNDIMIIGDESEYNSWDNQEEKRRR